MVVHCHQELCTKQRTISQIYSNLYFKSKGFDKIGFEESVWVRPAGGKYSEDIYVSAGVDDWQIIDSNGGV